MGYDVDCHGFYAETLKWLIVAAGVHTALRRW
jgi:hypothetical protein